MLYYLLPFHRIVIDLFIKRLSSKEVLVVIDRYGTGVPVLTELSTTQ
jgi:hypothetical protein